jgi:hypothetical protein
LLDASFESLTPGAIDAKLELATIRMNMESGDLAGGSVQGLDFC